MQILTKTPAFCFADFGNDLFGALALGYRMMVNVSTPRFAPLDIISVIMSAIAFGGVVYGLSNFFAEGLPVVSRWQLPPRSAASIRGRSASKANCGYEAV